MERVFLATLGMAPAVVTETLWALSRRDVPWVPDRIEIVSTLGGAAAVEQTLLVKGGPLSTLYPSPGTIPPVTVFIPIRDMASPQVRALTLTWTAGATTVTSEGDRRDALKDVDDDVAATCMGDLILTRVHAACRDPRNQLHLSISGGRKTMSAHALFSLGLVGNPQDEASHVLMKAEFENNRQFWHPDQGGLIHTAAVQSRHRDMPLSEWPAPTLDPAEAADGLKLFSIAAPRFDAMPDRGKAGGPLPRLSVIIDRMNLAGDWLRAPRLTLDPARNLATIVGQARVLDPMDFVWLRLLATAADEGWTCDRDGASQPAGAVTVARLIFGAPGYGNLLRLRDWFDAAMAAGRAGDSTVRRSAQRTELLARRPGTPDDSAAGEAVRAKITRWLQELRASEAQSARQRLSALEMVGDDVIKVLGSFTDLRDHLEELFGAPLAQALLPPRSGRPRKVNRLSQAAYALNGAGPGFLALEGAAR